MQHMPDRIVYWDVSAGSVTARMASGRTYILPLPDGVTRDLDSGYLRATGAISVDGTAIVWPRLQVALTVRGKPVAAKVHDPVRKEARLPDSFANHPPSITEIRSQKSDQSNAWTPRDALIDLLRAIDSGEMEVAALVVSVAVNLSDGVGHAYRVAAPDQFTALGLLTRAVHRIQEA